ncbi:tyrosine-type recombinase/integrase [Pelomonas sp. V22]|uniref:tyrosine-type recombinase/integrase n=1 Tax=Pelomonas sp. V22 TaxID=2822139 RepID=UPI0024A98B15|nr:tyrosine-type recombinase/integrase [Pelomonas sp. V22]MDI4635252.1 tyrosine-type recombinase/integrase [Pelomonas sp. V22]
MTLHQAPWSAPQPSKTLVPASVLEWPWPACPSSISIYDKYADVRATLQVSETTWSIPTRGLTERLSFSKAELGELQRKLAIQTQASNAPSTLAMFVRTMVNHWADYERLLLGGPTEVRALWAETIHDVTAAKAAKMILKLVCRLELGGWAPLHNALVKSLDTLADAPLRSQRGKLKRREKVLTVSTQADIVGVLDEAAVDPNLDELEAEGLAALALFFQHGMRPVQLLALRLEHLPAPVLDASGDAALVVSYHAAKQGGKTWELLRQVKPEWVSLLVKLRDSAIRAERSRAFSSTTAAKLWKLVKRACKERGLNVDFKAYGVRHTSAQSLADAGHDRASIKEFLGHGSVNAATTYLRASRQQGEIVNKALGASKLYETIIAFSTDAFIDTKQLLEAGEDQQIGAVVGSRLVAGIGICRSGQSNCSYNPVTSCYACSRFMPVAEVAPHQEAIAGMREQVQLYLGDSSSESSPAFLQLRTALSGAQQALELATSIVGEADVD